MKYNAQPASRSRFPLNAFALLVVFLLCCLCAPVTGQTTQNKPTVRPELVLQSGYAIYGASGMLFSPDARLLATWTFNSNTVKLWETATGRELRTLALGGGTTTAAAGGFQIVTLTGVSSVAFSRDGRLLAAGGRDNSIRIWNVVTGRELQTLTAAAPDGGIAASAGVYYLAFTPDARRLVSLGDALRTWDVATGGELGASELSLMSAAAATGGGFSSPFAISPDGKQLAGLTRDFSRGGGESRVMFWDLETGRAAQTVKAPSDFKSQGQASLAFAPDGRLLVASLDSSSGEKNKFQLWEFTAKNVKPRQLFTSDKSFGVFNFSADGRMLALASNNQVKIWDTATGAEIKTLDVPNRFAKLMPDVGVTALAFSADGRTLATSSFDTDITLWETATGRRAQRLSSRTNMAYEVAFSADGTRLHAGSKTVWDLTTGRGLRASAPVESPFGILSRDGRQLASMPLKGSQVNLYDTTNGRQLHSLTPQEKADSTSLVRFSPDGRILATTYRAENPMQVVSTNSPEAKANSKEMQKQAEQAMKEMLKNSKNSGVPDLSSIMGGAMTGGGMMKTAPPSIGSQVKLWDTATGREARTINVPSNHPFMPAIIHSVTFNADSSRLAVTNFNSSTVTLWDAQTGARAHTLGASPAAASSANPFGMPPNISAMMGGGGGSKIASVAFSADSKLLLTGGADTASNFDQGAMMRAMQAAMSDPKKARNSEAMMKEIYKDMKVTTTGAVKLWDLSAGRELRAFAGHTSEVNAVAFSADARLVAAAAADHTIKLWDAGSGRELHTLRGHTSSINSVAFSPDARLLASASADGSTVLWDAATGKQLATLVSLFDGADWLVVTPDGLFDGSPFAWNQILWRYDEDTFNIAPIEWFFNEFFYPGLLSDLATGKRPTAAADFAQKDRRQPTVKISLADNAPTTAAAAASTSGAPSRAVSTRDLKLKIEVSEASADASHPSGSGARDVRLFRNGALVRAWRGDVLAQRQSNATLEVTLPVVAGENRLTAYAFNRDNVKSKDHNLLVTGADSLKRAGTAYILAVGVNSYANAGYNLKYAVADAREFGEEVKRQQSKIGRYARVETISLYDTQATKANILAALAKLSAQTQPEDGVVIYFAGHGTAQANRFYLIPHDLGYMGSRTKLTEAAVKDILAHSISDVELEAAFEGVPATQIMLVIDACNSGQALEAEEKRRGPMNSKGLAQLAYEKGMYILTAAQSFQAAQEASEVGHGLLTYALVEEGLKQSAADAQPQNGEILVREWFDYATLRVPTMQIQKLKQARDAGLNLSFIEASAGSGDDERGLNLTKPVTQRPRVFYRRELEAQPLIIARP